MISLVVPEFKLGIEHGLAMFAFHCLDSSMGVQAGHTVIFSLRESSFAASELVFCVGDPGADMFRLFSTDFSRHLRALLSLDRSEVEISGFSSSERISSLIGEG